MISYNPVYNLMREKKITIPILCINSAKAQKGDLTFHMSHSCKRWRWAKKPCSPNAMLGCEAWYHLSLFLKYFLFLPLVLWMVETSYKQTPD